MNIVFKPLASLLRRSLFLIISCGLADSAALAFQGAPNLIANPSFEVLETTAGGFPTSVGDWVGNYSNIIAAAGGLQPAHGKMMLQFLGGDNLGCGGTLCSVVQLYAGPETAPGKMLYLRASFNRIVGPQVDTLFRVRLRAHSGLPSKYQVNGQIAEATGDVYSDDAATTWEAASSVILLPPDTTFVEAEENILSTPTCPELDGHYADSVELLLTCAEDVQRSGAVDVDDLIAVILGWGACPAPPAPCAPDVDHPGAVDVDDLIAVILAWGPCS
jgi:hypothetical protein